MSHTLHLLGLYLPMLLVQPQKFTVAIILEVLEVFGPQEEDESCIVDQFILSFPPFHAILLCLYKEYEHIQVWSGSRNQEVMKSIESETFVMQHMKRIQAGNH